MKKRIIPIAFALAFLLGCSFPVFAGDPEPRPGVAPDLSNEALGNFTYRCGMSDLDAAIAMKNGLYAEEPDPASSPWHLTANLVLATRGALPISWIDAEKDTDVAAVVYVWNLMGNEAMFNLTVLGPCTGAPEEACELACDFLGNRIDVQSVAIDKGRISVKMVEHGPDDPMCCPSVHVTRELVLEDGQLKEVSTPAK